MEMSQGKPLICTTDELLIKIKEKWWAILKKILASYIYDKGHVSRLYKEMLHATNDNAIKKWTKYWIDISAIDAWKHVLTSLVMREM